MAIAASRAKGRPAQPSSSIDALPSSGSGLLEALEVPPIPQATSSPGLRVPATLYVDPRSIKPAELQLARPTVGADVIPEDGLAPLNFGPSPHRFRPGGAEKEPGLELLDALERLREQAMEDEGHPGEPDLDGEGLEIGVLELEEPGDPLGDPLGEPLVAPVLEEAQVRAPVSASAWAAPPVERLSAHVSDPPGWELEATVAGMARPSGASAGTKLPGLPVEVTEPGVLSNVMPSAASPPLDKDILDASATVQMSAIRRSELWAEVARELLRGLDETLAMTPSAPGCLLYTSPSPRD